MNSLAYFKECEHPIERDGNEGVHTWLNPTKWEIVINGRRLTREGGTLSASFRFFADFNG